MFVRLVVTSDLVAGLVSCCCLLLLTVYVVAFVRLAVAPLPLTVSCCCLSIVTLAVVSVPVDVSCCVCEVIVNCFPVDMCG